MIHEIRFGEIKYGNGYLTFEDGEVVEHFDQENRETSPGTIECACGESFLDLEDAEEHLKEVNEG